MEESSKIDLVSALIPFVLVVFVIAIGVVILNQQFRKNIYKQRLEKESLKAQHQTELLENSIRVQEDERKRIARDIHDELGATLSIGRMHLKQLAKNDTTNKEKVIQIQDMLEQALIATRRISHELMPLKLESLGLEKALYSLRDQLNNNPEENLLEIQFDLDEGVLTKEVELALYRVFSELINNTLKHAGASIMQIHITEQANHIVCSYQDNGKGIVENQQTEGLGFRSIENRIVSHKGKWNFKNNPNGGFYAEIELPLIDKTYGTKHKSGVG